MSEEVVTNIKIDVRTDHENQVVMLDFGGRAVMKLGEQEARALGMLLHESAAALRKNKRKKRTS